MTILRIRPATLGIICTEIRKNHSTPFHTTATRRPHTTNTNSRSCLAAGKIRPPDEVVGACLRSGRRDVLTVGVFVGTLRPRQERLVEHIAQGRPEVGGLHQRRVRQEEDHLAKEMRIVAAVHKRKEQKKEGERGSISTQTRHWHAFGWLYHPRWDVLACLYRGCHTAVQKALLARAPPPSLTSRVREGAGVHPKDPFARSLPTAILRCCIYACV